MDQAKDIESGTGKSSYGKWIAWAAAAAGVTAAAVVLLRKRADSAAQVGRILDRCDAAVGELRKRLAA